MHGMQVVGQLLFVPFRFGVKNQNVGIEARRVSQFDRRIETHARGVADWVAELILQLAFLLNNLRDDGIGLLNVAHVEFSRPQR